MITPAKVVQLIAEEIDSIRRAYRERGGTVEAATCGAIIEAVQSISFDGDRLGRRAAACVPDDACLLLSDHEHAESAEMIRALELVLEMYARRDAWFEVRTGEPPRYLRRGLALNFNPANVVDGFVFAEEVLGSLARFRERQTAAQDEIDEDEAADLVAEFDWGF